jgi:hypothetical protein
MAACQQQQQQQQQAVDTSARRCRTRTALYAVAQLACLCAPACC